MLQQQITASSRTVSQATSMLPPIPAEPVVSKVQSSPIPNISLDEFCLRYSVDEVDHNRLEKMEFRPGDDIDQLGSEEWKGLDGFTTLSWSRIQRKNRQFLDDVRKGSWESN